MKICVPRTQRRIDCKTQRVFTVLGSLLLSLGVFMSLRPQFFSRPARCSLNIHVPTEYNLPHNNYQKMEG
jgi:hypothetical protein